ncbi:pantothenate synthetase [Nonlabens sp. Hel1_33_55]|uniref:pantoate--beta-alanine ligase n=1 Tax=Nonlabens sp. Hel1_33_55 TaxID=1336802 RepID=UPI000875BF4E|nr:pantoate--beta-alanine ligase [Nonlabens sp. Hel1_33_55]SCY35508.1 pantothenate synthetase [Nonlabens sp. Hel1_33_55]
MFVGYLPNSQMVFTAHKKLSLFLDDIRYTHNSIGFVPTMGALHDGHLALMSKALDENDFLVISIFVNPTQFNNKADLEKYPRLLEQDHKKILAHISKDQFVLYAPAVEDVYGKNATSNKYDFGSLENVMEGAQRPGHFDGVGTILEFLFKVVKPDRAYFGEKDFQQLQIIKELVKILGLDLEIVGCPIHREKSGLAMSSRNGRLSPESFEKAAHIYRTLSESKAYFQDHDIKETIDFVEQKINAIAEFELEYFTIAEEQTLLPASNKEANKKYRAFIVVHLQDVRLIDNIPLY